MGCIAVRDLVDSHFFHPVSQALSVKPHSEISSYDFEIKPNGELYGAGSFWQMDEEGPNRLTASLVKNWKSRQNIVLLRTLEKELGQSFKTEWNKGNSPADVEEQLKTAYRFLNSPEGKITIIEFHKK